jgi:hypothetical protein
LLSAKLDPEQGFDLAKSALDQCASAPRVFFSRKAFLSDALKAQKNGLPVVEKPDPDNNDKGTEEVRMDSAMMRAASNLAIEFDAIISRNSWWGRNHAWFSGFALGLFFFFLGLLWEASSSSSFPHPLSLSLVSVLAAVLCAGLSYRSR